MQIHQISRQQLSLVVPHLVPHLYKHPRLLRHQILESPRKERLLLHRLLPLVHIQPPHERLARILRLHRILRPKHA